MNPEKCESCENYNTAECRAENCPNESYIENKKSMKRATWHEVMKLMSQRSGDSL